MGKVKRERKGKEGGEKKGETKWQEVARGENRKRGREGRRQRPAFPARGGKRIGRGAEKFQ